MSEELNLTSIINTEFAIESKLNFELTIESIIIDTILELFSKVKTDFILISELELENIS